MADEGTHYSPRYEEPTPDEALEELDWASPEGPPVEEVATLIYEILGTSLRRHPDLRAHEKNHDQRHHAEVKHERRNGTL